MRAPSIYIEYRPQQTTHLCQIGSDLLLEPILYGFVKYHFFLKAVSSRLGGLNHADYFGVGAAVFTTASKCCN